MDRKRRRLAVEVESQVEGLIQGATWQLNLARELKSNIVRLAFYNVRLCAPVERMGKQGKLGKKGAAGGSADKGGRGGTRAGGGSAPGGGPSAGGARRRGRGRGGAGKNISDVDPFI